MCRIKKTKQNNNRCIVVSYEHLSDSFSKYPQRSILLKNRAKTAITLQNYNEIYSENEKCEAICQI